MPEIIGKDNYREIIEEAVGTHQSTHGYQSHLAKAAGCHTSYISQVRRSHVQLSLDHAAGLCRFWQLTEEETEYFLTLVAFERAASANLKQHLQRKMRRIKQAHLNLTKRLRAPQGIEAEHQLTYYSAWYWAAIHVLSSVPGYNTATALATALQISPQLAAKCLERLAAMGLLEKKGNQWLVTKRSTHIGDDSPLAEINHANWRQYALGQVHAKSEDALSYTGVYTLSQNDYLKVRALCLELIEKTRSIVAPSPEEVGCCLLLDLLPFGHA